MNVRSLCECNQRNNMKSKDKLAITKNWYQYHVPGCPRTHRVKKNAIFISTTNTIRHEMSKCLGAYLLKKYGDIKFDSTLIAKIGDLELYVKEVYRDWKECHSEFITEAVPCSDSNRRIDLVDLKQGTKFEFETNHSIKKEGAITIYI